jgi:hypothetical protein
MPTDPFLKGLKMQKSISLASSRPAQPRWQILGSSSIIPLNQLYWLAMAGVIILAAIAAGYLISSTYFLSSDLARPQSTQMTEPTETPMKAVPDVAGDKASIKLSGPNSRKISLPPGSSNQ